MAGKPLSEVLDTSDAPTVQFTAPPGHPAAKRKRGDPSDPRPTKAMIAKLLRAIQRGGYSYTTQDIEEANAAADKMRDRLLKTPAYVKLRKRADALRDEHQTRQNKFRERWAKLERRFLVEGATPAILKEANELRKEYEAARATRPKPQIHTDYP